MTQAQVIAILGGTGALGSGLAARLSHAGHTVIIGSRDPVRAAQWAERTAAKYGGVMRGADYESAAREAELERLSTGGYRRSRRGRD
jgi:predicted dinucleotide-binding enzyme